MHVQFEGTLASVRTKRAKRDKDGIVTEEPAIAVTLEVPVSAISPAGLGSLLRAMERGFTVALDDGQRSFDVVDRGGEIALVPEPVAGR
jgi:hypothetical protein